MKLQEKVGWRAPPRVGVTISSEWSVKSPVSGCLLVSSFTDTPVVGGRQIETFQDGCGRGLRKKAAGRGDSGTHLCHQESEFSHPSAS